MNRWKAIARAWVAPFCAAVFLAGTGPAGAADWSSPPPVPIVTIPADRFEVRFGVFAHGIGSVEQGTFDINAELVSPRLSFGTVTGPWAFLIPRLHVGGNWNTSNRTSFAYTGFLWTIPVWDRFFVEGYIGPAIHNGSLGPTDTLSGLGCPVLFHSGGSIGYQLTPNLRVIGTFDHLSNGRTLFGVQCGTNLAPGRNQGLNNYGLRVGYSF